VADAIVTLYLPLPTFETEVAFTGAGHVEAHTKTWGVFIVAVYDDGAMMLNSAINEVGCVDENNSGVFKASNVEILGATI
jgi:hypothetical protein